MDIVMVNTIPSVVSTASVDLKGAMAIEKLVDENSHHDPNSQTLVGKLPN